MLWRSIWVKSLRSAGILLLQCQGKNFAYRQQLKFCHFQPVHCASKNSISPTYSTDFRNLRLSSKMLTVGIWVESFRCAGILHFAMARWKLCASTTSEILPLSICTMSQQKSYTSRGIQPIFEIFALAQRCCGGGIWVKSCKFAGILLLQCQGENFALRQQLKFCHFQPVHCASKNPISPKVFNRFSKSLPPARRIWGWAFGWKVSGAQIFYSCNGKVKALRIDNLWNFATLNQYTVPGKKPNISNGIQPIFEIFAWAPRCWRCAFGWKALGAQVILLLQCQSEHFAHRQHLKCCHFQSAHCASKNPISPKLFIQFSKSSPQLEDVEGGHLGGTFTCPGILLLQWQDENFAHRHHFKFCHFQRVHRASKNPVSPKVFNRIFDIFSSAQRCWGWTFGWKVSCAQVMYFCNGMVKTLAHRQHLKSLSTCTLCSQKSYFSKGTQTIFEIFASARRLLRVGIWVESFRCAGNLLLQCQGENCAHRQHLKFYHFQPVHCASKNAISSKSIQPIFEIFASTRRCWGWAFWWESFRSVGIVLLQWQRENFEHRDYWKFCFFQPVHCASKNPLQRYSTNFRNLCLSSKMLRVGIWAETFTCPGILLLQWQDENFAASTTFEVLPLSICTLCQQISYISKGILPIFEIFASARKCWGWAFGWKCLRCAGVLILLWQGENFGHRQHLKSLSTCTLC